MHKMIQDVTEFHKCFGHPILSTPQRPPLDRQSARLKYIQDELTEFEESHLHISEDWQEADEATRLSYLAEFGDAIADMIYYLIGTALEYGIPLGPIWDAVQRANMAKLWTYEDIKATEDGSDTVDWTTERVLSPSLGEPRFVVKDPTGKVRKPPSWKEPDIVAVIKQALAGQPAANALFQADNANHDPGSHPLDSKHNTD